MAKTNLAFSGNTKLENDAVTDVNVGLKRTVTYIFNAKSAKNLVIPYAVAIGGIVKEEFKIKPKQVIGSAGRIVVRNVEPGAKVTLFLNSDAHPGYRKNPVYPITPSDRDVVVEIEEKKGRHLVNDMPVRNSKAASADIDSYEALLTGDIWMKVSHKYSVEEAMSLVPQDIAQVIKNAIKKIFEGLARPSLEISASEAEKGEKKELLIIFEDSENARENISQGYEFLKEGLTRVHPAGYAAIFAAAIETGVNKLVMTSAWRPMLGSIAHRAGLGLDINYINSTRINREKLRKKSALNTGLVSEEEKSLFTSLESAKQQQLAAQKAIAAAEIDVKNAKDEPAQMMRAKQKMSEAVQTVEIAEKNRKDAETKWNAERDRNEPELVKKFRASLMSSKSVSQLFDPWFMDPNSRDNVPAVPNIQLTDNEKLHAHHLHITVCEPKIL